MLRMIRLAALAGIAISGALSADEPSRPAANNATIESLKAELDALKPAKLAWREIQWKSCLLDGLKESRASHKPMLLWIFIDRPADDARC